MVGIPTTYEPKFHFAWPLKLCTKKAKCHGYLGYSINDNICCKILGRGYGKCHRLLLASER